MRNEGCETAPSKEVSAQMKIKSVQVDLRGEVPLMRGTLMLGGNRVRTKWVPINLDHVEKRGTGVFVELKELRDQMVFGHANASKRGTDDSQ